MITGRALSTNDESARAPDAERGADWLDPHDRFASLDEIARAAREALSGPALTFLEGWAGQGVTERANRAAFDRWTFRPRVLSGIGAPDTRTTFLGLDLALPVLTAPFAAGRMYHPEGHLAVARANQRFGTASIVPELSSESLEEIAAEAPLAACVFQLYPALSQANFVRLGRRARLAGYQALCVTVDYPVSGWRDRVREERFVGNHDDLLANYADRRRDGEQLLQGFSGLDRRQWTWAQLTEACRDVGLPFAIKGIVTAEDARSARDAGAAAVVVSNHGGRQLDGAPGSLDALGEVVGAVTGDLEIGLDSGVRNGTDLAKALALGADAVIIGRLTVQGLAAAGTDGVHSVLQLLQQELKTTMSLVGRGSIGDLDASAVRRGPT